VVSEGVLVSAAILPEYPEIAMLPLYNQLNTQGEGYRLLTSSANN
jgi:hypothetical protein